MLTYAAAGTVSIGTASARGDIRVDSYTVKGNATLFDGSVVETGRATADLRLDKGTSITMSTGSRGTLYRDHLVLEQGQGELAASNTFQLVANGLRVSPNESNSRGLVALKTGNTVEVEALRGSFGVSHDGIQLASIHPGQVFLFAMQADANPANFSGSGIVSFENGRYFFTSDAGVKYEVGCKDLHRFVGMKVDLSGKLQRANAPAGGGGPIVCADSVSIHGPTAMSERKKLLIAGVIIGSGLGLGIGLYEANLPPTPASI